MNFTCRTVFPFKECNMVADSLSTATNCWLYFGTNDLSIVVTVVKLSMNIQTNAVKKKEKKKKSPSPGPGILVYRVLSI